MLDVVVSKEHLAGVVIEILRYLTSFFLDRQLDELSALAVGRGNNCVQKIQAPVEYRHIISWFPSAKLPSRHFHVIVIQQCYYPIRLF